ncbi:NPR2-domain-containing protein [Westerdykella ornata]|uniref:NPR2-domain-containing protein n=1 Tax=Westerdykella ornata TaxID=318751 RepID=A0A6A6JAE2_WESOR|nr:NPR2-domain-containing protein [Westerdykella ornata]KAF2273372.1 NPR2-domain-containing protein [Westerdykella ornata]
MPTRAIKAIFFARFHHEKGSRVLHQVPEGSITPSSDPSALPSPLFDFDSVSTYLIPTQQFCDRLITLCTNHHRILGYPVCVREGKYSRNEYIFNFALVIDEAIKDWAAYGEVVRKMGRLLRGLEEQAGFLSREEENIWQDGRRTSIAGLGIDTGAPSKIYALCEVVLEDLNNYAECMIPIDDSNTINLKLFPAHPPPPPIHSYQVPLLTISLSSLTSPISSDLTLNRITPYINGINSVNQIAHLADTDLSLTKKALQHLAYYGCLVLLDVFHFGAIYAPTADIGAFIVEKSVQEECARYVRVPRARPPSSNKRTRLRHDSSASTSTVPRTRDSVSSNLSSEPTRSESNASSSSHLAKSDFDVPSPSASRAGEDVDDNDNNGEEEADTMPNPLYLITLYTSLRQGLPLRNWVLENVDLLRGIDIRRFITFGIVKGFLYRVQRYAILTGSVGSTPGAGTQAYGQGHGNVGPEEGAGGGGKQVHDLKTGSAAAARKASTMTMAMSSNPHPAPSGTKTPTTITTTTTVTATATATPAGAAISSGGGRHKSISSHSHSLAHTHTHTHAQEEPHSSSSYGKDVSGFDTTALPPLPPPIPAARAAPPSPPTADDVQGPGRFLPLIRFLDGMHCFDEICTEVGAGERVVEEKVRGVGEVGFFWK